MSPIVDLYSDHTSTCEEHIYFHSGETGFTHAQRSNMLVFCKLTTVYKSAESALNSKTCFMPALIYKMADGHRESTLVNTISNSNPQGQSNIYISVIRQLPGSSCIFPSLSPSHLSVMQVR